MRLDPPQTTEVVTPIYDRGGVGNPKRNLFVVNGKTCQRGRYRLTQANDATRLSRFKSGHLLH